MATFRCYDHNKFSPLSNTVVVVIFLNLCLWRRSLCSNLLGIDPEKLYLVTVNVYCTVKTFSPLFPVICSEASITRTSDDSTFFDFP